MRSFMILILYRSLGGAEQCIPLKVNKDFSEINDTKFMGKYLFIYKKLFYIIDPQFLAYLYNGLVPGVIYYKPLSYEANFLQA